MNRRNISSSSIFRYRCDFNSNAKKIDGVYKDEYNGGSASTQSIDHLNKEELDQIMQEALTRLPSCTYCRYNVDHVFKTLKERETHEIVCPDRAAYERKNA
jgi:hypothetical protein